MNIIRIALILAIWTALGPAWADTPQAKIISDSTHLYTDPNADSSVLLEIFQDALVTIAEEKGDWVLIRTSDDRVGWVLLADLEKLPVQVSSPDADDARKVEPEILESPTSPRDPEPTIAHHTPRESTKDTPRTQLQPTISNSKPVREFYEVSLNIRPGFDKATTHPPGMDDSGFSIGSHLAWFFSTYVGLHVPYTFRYYEGDAKIHTAGGGPIIRFLDLKHFRGAIDANFLYARAFGRNEIGWSVGGDLTIGHRETVLRPFIGPFVRYEKILADGPDLTTWSFGVTVSLTNFTDHF